MRLRRKSAPLLKYSLHFDGAAIDAKRGCAVFAAVRFVSFRPFRQAVRNLFLIIYVK
jgi:hypothetical protein